MSIMDHGVGMPKTGEKSYAAPYVQYSEVEPVKTPGKCYKPLIHRTPSFLFFFVIALALIGVVEYACRNLPHKGWENLISAAKHLHERDDLHARQTKVGSANPNLYLSTALVTTTAPSAYLASTTALSTNPSAYLQGGTSTTIPSAYLHTGTSATNPSAYLQPGTSATNPSAYLNPSTTPTPTIVPSSTSSAYLNPGTTPTVFPSSASSAYLNSATAPKNSAAPDSAYLYSGTSSALSVTFNNYQGSGTSSTTGQSTTVGAEPTSSYLDPAAVRTSPTTSRTASTTSTYPPVTTTSPTSPALEPSTGKHPPLRNLTQAKYFVGAYLPTLLAVVFRISVGSLYAATKMLEPFFSLARPQGATAKNFFHINYLATNDNLDPIKAMLSGHWLMLWTSILYLAVGLMTPFASELLHFARYCDARSVCGPELRINPDIARILQALLVFTAIMLINVWWLQRKHSSGVYQDPSSIASLASLLHHPEVLADFQRMHPDASKGDMLKAVGEKRYRLDNYRAADGTERYGLVPLGGVSTVHDNAHQPFLGHNIDAARQERAAKQHHTKRIIRDVVFGLVTAGMLIIVTYYYKVGSNSGFERFMDSQSFGPRFLFAIVGILIHSQWKRIERESAIFEPFRRLHAGPSPPSTTILTPLTLTPFSTLSTALFRGNFFVAHVAFVAVLAEILIIVLAGIPFSAGQLHTAFVISAYLCMAILAYMLVGLVAVWSRGKGVRLPRTPNTLASVWGYLCGSRLVYDFAEFARVQGRERDRAVMGLGRNYVLKRDRGMDGAMRWGVDYADDGRMGA